VTRRRKLLTLAGAFVVVALTVTLWPKPRGYTYQGKTVQEWFEEIVNNIGSTWPNGTVDDEKQTKVDSACEAFRNMGTNAVPFLTSQINRDFRPTLLEKATSRLPKAWQLKPRNRHFEAQLASALLQSEIKPPENMLRELLKPTLSATNQPRRRLAELALPSSLALSNSIPVSH